MLSYDNKVKYSLFYCLVIVLIMVLVICWWLSFVVPLDESQPVQWMMSHRVGLFSTYIILNVLLLGLFIGSMYSLRNDVLNPIDLFELPDIFFLAVSILLLSAFFIYQDNVTEYKRFYDTHPLIIYTTAYLLLLGIVAVVIDHIQIHIAQHLQI